MASQQANSDTPGSQDFYAIGGMQVDVNPFQQKDSPLDCNLILNWYSHKYLSKKVRFGYAKFLDNPDNMPVRNLIYYQFPNSSGILRVSGGHTYVTTTASGSWGSPISGLDWTDDTVLGTAQLSGSKNYVHMSNAVDGYKTWDGTNAKSWTGSYTPKANFLAAYQGRIFGDVNQLSLAESQVGFDFLNPPITYPGTGTLGVTDGSTNVMGSGTFFTTQLTVGSVIYIGGVAYTVHYINNDDNLVLETPFSGTTASGLSFLYSFSTVDPFYYSPASSNPAQGGVTPLDSGNNGAIVDMSVVQNTLLIYKQRAIYRYDGTNFLTLNFANSVIPRSVAVSDYTKTNYFVSYNSIWTTDAQSVVPASFGVNTIIQDTFTNLGVQQPISFCFDYLSFFWFGNIWFQPNPSVNPVTIRNAMLVKDERFNEWYIWSVGHTVTAFGSYTDANNVRHMITGDSLGNTYVWGEQYTSDDGVPISYQLRTKYIDHGSPSGTKVPQPQTAVSADTNSEATVSSAKNFSDKYIPLGSTSGVLSKFNKSVATPSYKNVSIEVAGSTTTNRPELYGITLNLDEEEHFSDQSTNRTGRN